TTYTCGDFNPDGYTIAVYHGATSPGSLQQHHVPPIIQDARYDPCNYSVSLSWSPYVGWDEADILYHIYAIMGGQTQQLAGNVAGASFLWEDVPDNKEITFYVQAVRKSDAGVKSDSPHVLVTTATPQRPAIIDLSRLEYDGNEVRLHFHIDPSTALTQFEIQRAADDAGFETQYAFSDKTLSAYTDNAAGIFRYRVAAENDCNQIARVSDTLQNFKLDMTSQYNAWQLQWNRPVSGESYVFSLQRVAPNPAVLLANTTGVSFSDPVSSMQNVQSLEYCYRLEASTPRGLSLSEACAFYKPRIAMPDAVDPLSAVINTQTGRARNRFGPVLNVHPVTYAYQLRIINRNGAKIADITKEFNDDPLEKSWNGRFANGGDVPEEVYTYYLEVHFEGGRTETLTGPVMVMYE
ncbi:MAG: hypothetical protein LBF69_07215, partial [Prevotellaceae bacterium]|nr:hypothetical protein [Prevotellaceae bacterium]